MIGEIDIFKLVIAVLIGYGIVFLIMWLFGRKREKKEKKENKAK